MVGALTQSYIRNGGSKIRLHKTLHVSLERLPKTSRNRPKIHLLNILKNVTFYVRNNEDNLLYSDSPRFVSNSHDIAIIRESFEIGFGVPNIQEGTVCSSDQLFGYPKANF